MKLNEFKLERYFAKYEFKTAYNLCASDCEPLTINDLLEMEEGSLSALKKQGLGYTESAGDPELLELVSGLYTTIIPDQILTFSGAEEAIFIFMNVLLNPGDHIIVQFPAYQSLFEIAQTIGCKVTLWELDSLNDWELDLQVLLDDINPRTRAIIINFPHNPTGTHISRQKLNQIIDIAQENNIYLFSDEVYRLLEYNSLQRLPAVCDLYDNGVSLGVMSKAFGLAGLRIGWISSPNRELLKQLSMFKDYTTICNSASSEFLAKIALKQVDTIVERNLNIINQNHELFSEFFANFKEF
ncbi:aminotransferase class I/II-fold pyridoxal phosphate-dependent enzyme, partial [Candidatus Hodarchaeum mangrovi]